jgi:uncharacterized glyoxalase superfamily protein PhnB
LKGSSHASRAARRVHLSEGERRCRHGHREAAFKHYEKILDGKILMMVRYADAPADAGIPQNPETAARIMHARLQVGDRLLMGGDAPPQLQPNRKDSA